jgi:hypothetical protein
MMLNNKDNAGDMTLMFSAITNDIYQNTTDDMIHFTKGLLMKVEPWKVGWENKLAAMFSTFDEAVNSLYGIVIGFHN